MNMLTSSEAALFAYKPREYGPLLCLLPVLWAQMQQFCIEDFAQKNGPFVGELMRCKCHVGANATTGDDMRREHMTKSFDDYGYAYGPNNYAWRP